MNCTVEELKNRHNLLPSVIMLFLKIIIRGYMENYKGDNWLPAYRTEIGLASAWLFHHTECSKKVRIVFYI